MVNAIGYVSTVCICAAMLPQLVKVIRTRNVHGLSLRSFLLYDLGNITGLAYGIGITSWPNAITSMIAGMISLTITVMIMRERFAPLSVENQQ